SRARARRVGRACASREAREDYRGEHARDGGRSLRHVRRRAGHGRGLARGLPETGRRGVEEPPPERRMNALVVLAVSLPASLTVIVVASLRFAKKITAMEQDEERCDAITPGKKGTRRCVYRRGHWGAHHTPED